MKFCEELKTIIVIDKWFNSLIMLFTEKMLKAKREQQTLSFSPQLINFATLLQLPWVLLHKSCENINKKNYTKN